MSRLTNWRTVVNWRELAANSLEMNNADARMVDAMAKSIMERWQKRVGENEEAMAAVYLREQEQALTAIVAAAKLIQYAGKGTSALAPSPMEVKA